MKKIYSLMAAGLFLSVFAGCQKDSSTPPEYPEAPDLACVKIGDVWWAPVNCGYTSTHTYGLLYQWGRKYGQAYEDGTITPTALTKAQGNDPAFSGQFGERDESNNWFSGGVDKTLWPEDSKGTYDPCPDGWRVPTVTELRALNNSTKEWITNGGTSSDQTGYLFGTSPDQVFLPASGIRSQNDGAVSGRNTSGYYWSSSLTGNTASCLCIYSDKTEFAAANLAGGRPVRCVKDVR